MTAITAPNRKSILRKQLRLKRRSLSRQQQHLAAVQLARQFFRSALLGRKRHIALYFANDGEIDLSILLKKMLRCRCHCYMPTVLPNGKLEFLRYRKGDRLTKNRYGIPELKRPAKVRKPWSIGLILLPLVGFDRSGNRLGMGGGYYDRTFAQTRGQKNLFGATLLAGVAHHCQEVDNIDLDSWDIPLSLLITDLEVIPIN